jgi:UDP-glucose 4-epimerase
VALSLDADLVFTSTSDVYGNGTPPYSEDGELVIGPPTTKRWAYAVSKMYDEHYGLALADERDLKLTILRLFNAYGPRNHLSWWGGPVVTFVESLLDGECMEIHGDGQQTRTFTHVRDIADGIVAALERPESRGEVVNLGGTETITILELAHLVQAELGMPSDPLRAKFLSYESLPGKYQDVRHRTPDTTKARRLLGFEARIRLAEGLRETVAWHQSLRDADAAAEA